MTREQLIVRHHAKAAMLGALRLLEQRGRAVALPQVKREITGNWPNTVLQ